MSERERLLKEESQIEWCFTFLYHFRFAEFREAKFLHHTELLQVQSTRSIRRPTSSILEDTLDGLATFSSKHSDTKIIN